MVSPAPPNAAMWIRPTIWRCSMSAAIGVRQDLKQSLKWYGVAGLAGRRTVPRNAPTSCAEK